MSLLLLLLVLTEVNPTPTLVILSAANGPLYWLLQLLLLFVLVVPVKPLTTPYQQTASALASHPILRTPYNQLSMSQQTITAVLFDYGMVLSGPPDPAAWIRLKQIFHADEPAFHAAFWNHRDDYDRGALNAVTYWQAVANDLHQTLTPTQLAELIAADNILWTQPNQPMIDWAATLQRANIKTGILSNIGDEMERGILAHFPWLQNFNHHTFSHRLGIAKPDLAIYHHAAEGLATPPSEILFLDDREENIAAARTAGMTAIQYTTHPAFIESMTTQNLTHLLHP